MKGILFKPDMIKAIVEGKKTMTRRVIKPQPLYQKGVLRWIKSPNKVDINMDDHADLAIPYARYQAGETVYIKEKITRKRNDPSVGYDYATYALDLTPVIFYLSANRFVWHWQKDYLSPLHLPYEAARYFIKITDVRAEKLNNITKIGAQNEGVTRPPNYSLTPHYREWFKYLWDTINKPPYDWNSNCWVFVYSFKKIEKEASE